METKTPPEKPAWYSIKDASEYLDVGEQTLYRWIREGSITYRRIGDSIRFLQQDLDGAVEVFPSLKDAGRVREFCAVCHYSPLVEGTAQSTGRVMFRPSKSRFWTLQEGNVEAEARMCPRCGAIFLFGNTEKLSSLQPATEKSGTAAEPKGENPPPKSKSKPGGPGLKKSGT